MNQPGTLAALASPFISYSGLSESYFGIVIQLQSNLIKCLPSSKSLSRVGEKCMPHGVQLHYWILSIQVNFS